MNGTIKKLNSEKGFGFITPDDGSKDVFFHSTSCVDGNFDQLREGDKVTLEVEDSPKGPRAANVRLA